MKSLKNLMKAILPAAVLLLMVNTASAQYIWRDTFGPPYAPYSGSAWGENNGDVSAYVQFGYYPFTIVGPSNYYGYSNLIVDFRSGGPFVSSGPWGGAFDGSGVLWVRRLYSTYDYPVKVEIDESWGSTVEIVFDSQPDGSRSMHSRIFINQDIY